jgi:P27 family predicted phage terminase small subunit
MAGRRPKPTGIKELTGNPGHRPLNENEPKPQGQAICPKGLDAAGRHEWERVAQELERMNLLTSVDQAAPTAYCICWSNAMKAQADVQKYGATIFIEKKDRKGRWHVISAKRNPACTALRENLQLLRQYEVEFGMTPSSRSRVHAPSAVHVHEEKDVFAEIAEENRRGVN